MNQPIVNSNDSNKILTMRDIPSAEMRVSGASSHNNEANDRNATGGTSSDIFTTNLDVSMDADLAMHLDTDIALGMDLNEEQHHTTGHHFHGSHSFAASPDASFHNRDRAAGGNMPRAPWGCLPEDPATVMSHVTSSSPHAQLCGHQYSSSSESESESAMSPSRGGTADASRSMTDHVASASIKSGIGGTARTSSEPSKRRFVDSVKLPFPWKVQEMLEHCSSQHLENVVSWLPHGKSFKIYNQKEFVEHIMPMYFNQSKITSFTRQLYMYGFQKCQGAGPEKGAFYHPSFLRDNKDKCLTIQRKPDKPSYPRRAAKALSAAKRGQKAAALAAKAVMEAGRVASAGGSAKKSKTKTKSKGKTAQSKITAKTKSKRKSAARATTGVHAATTATGPATRKKRSAASPTATKATKPATTGCRQRSNSAGVGPVHAATACPQSPQSTASSASTESSWKLSSPLPSLPTSTILFTSATGSNVMDSMRQDEEESQISAQSIDADDNSLKDKQLQELLNDCDSILDTMRETLRGIESQLQEATSPCQQTAAV